MSIYREVARILNKAKITHAQDEGRIFLRIYGTNLPFSNGVSHHVNNETGHKFLTSASSICKMMASLLLQRVSGAV